MAAVDVPLASLTDGVSTKPMPERGPGTVKDATNCTMHRLRGLEKRPGTRLLRTDQTDYSLAVTNPTQTKSIHWIDRDDDEKFVVLIDPLNTTTAKVEVFTLVTRGNGSGTLGNEKAGQKMPLTSVVSGSDDPLTYIGLGSTAVRDRYRTLTVADATIICNRDVEVGFSGSAIDYKTEALNLIRKVGTTNKNNVASWNDLPQPPLGTAADGDTINDYLYYTRDDDLGWPAGWYRASSTTTPPWYTRIRTEPASSKIDQTKWPVRLNFTGTAFELKFPAWQDRYSGDSFTNPGPQLASGPSAPHKISDICYFQSRLWFGGYEFFDSSQSGDAFNLWNTSYVGLTDADPINESFQSDTVTVLDWMVPFDGGIVALTRGERQFEIRSQGAMTPSTVSILPSTSISTSVFCPPAKMGNQLYFVSDQQNYVLIYEYSFQADRSSNTARNATDGQEGYILYSVYALRASTQNDMLFALSTNAGQAIYVCNMRWNQQGQIEQRAWHAWTFGEIVRDCQVYGSKLYVLGQRSGANYNSANTYCVLTVDLAIAEKDTDGLTPTTVNGYGGSGDMNMALRIDDRGSYQGVYDAALNVTTWTVPYVNLLLNTVILGQMWDDNYEFPVGTPHEQRSKGKQITNLTVTRVGTTTTIKASGNYATNGHGDNAPVWIGQGYSKTATLNEQFVRKQDGSPAPGSVQLRSMRLNLVDTISLKVTVTPQGRSAITNEYSKDSIGQVTFDERLTAPAFDEFNMHVFGSARDTEVTILNDSPYPSRVVGGSIGVTFTPQRDPTKK